MPIMVKEYIARRKQYIIFMVPTASRLLGRWMAAVNDAMREIVEELKKRDVGDVERCVGVLTYGFDARWCEHCLTEEGKLKPLRDFEWKYLPCEGVNNLGIAMSELNESMSRKDKMASDTGCVTPIVVFISPGEPNDDWEPCFQRLAENPWYRVAAKVAFAVGDREYVDMDELARIVGCGDRVGVALQASDDRAFVEAFKRVVCMLALSLLIPCTAKDEIRELVGDALQMFGSEDLTDAVECREYRGQEPSRVLFESKAAFGDDLFCDLS